MTVVFIKRECDRHPGCFTMTDKCERCVVGDFRARSAANLAEIIVRVRDALGPEGNERG